MNVTTLYIKNMVCNRCIMVVKRELTKFGLNIDSIELGKVNLNNSPETIDFDKISNMLEINGFELLVDKKSRIVNKIKTLIIENIQHYTETSNNINISLFLSEKIGKDYSYLSNLFSLEEGITIEKYIILQKIEKIKELILYDELTLSQIAIEMNYSSVAYLSNQFKKNTGLTPSQFKKTEKHTRKTLDKI